MTLSEIAAASAALPSLRRLAHVLVTDWKREHIPGKAHVFLEATGSAIRAQDAQLRKARRVLCVTGWWADKRGQRSHSRANAFRLLFGALIARWGIIVKEQD